EDLAMVHGPIPTDGQFVVGQSGDFSRGVVNVSVSYCSGERAAGEGETLALHASLLSMRACSPCELALAARSPVKGFPGVEFPPRHRKVKTKAKCLSAKRARRGCARADTHLHKQYASLLPSKLHKPGGGGELGEGFSTASTTSSLLFSSKKQGLMQNPAISTTRSQRLEQRRPTELQFKASLSCRREQHLCLSARLPPRIPVKALKPELCGELIDGPRNQELNDTKKESGERKLREREKGGKSVQEDSFLLTHWGNPAALHPRFQVNEPLRSRPRVWEPGLGCECNAAKVALSTLYVSLFFSDPAMTAKCSKT
ncbi:Usherin, partial [Dissostichus eleginoides]